MNIDMILNRENRNFDTLPWQHQLCGRGENFTIWNSPKNSDFGHCFEEIAFIFTTHCLLAIASTYHAAQWRGSCMFFHRKSPYVYIRMFLTVLLLMVPILQLILTRTVIMMTLSLVDICTSVVVSTAWLLHLFYLYRLQSMYWFSIRGSFLVNVFFVASFIAVCLKVHSEALLRIHHHIHYNVIEEITTYLTICLQFLYALTWIPRKVHADSSNLAYETDQLLPETPSSTVDLKQAEYANCLSKLTFQWVTPLMVKGSRGEIHKAPHLFRLPQRLNPTTIQERFKDIMNFTRTISENILISPPPINDSQFDESLKNINEEEPSFSSPSLISHHSEHTRRRSLLEALHVAFGKEYYLLGMLKLCADAVGFLGPILLNKLVSYIENAQEEESHGYWYALGLFLSTLSGALCTVHFNYRITSVGYKIRIAIITTIYRKTVAVNSLHMSKFTSGEIVNFMSTDTDRIVNFCPSFHSVWSLPFQIGVSLYLLYLQVGLSFLAGLGFALLLIPINKWLATKIGDLSTCMMACKDKRVELMNEVLHGIRLIKLCAWERHFTARINQIRDRELSHLKGRKYLDALCVYFWATTPVLISILTFTTYSLLGNQLTAAKVFTSLSLFMMLIGPLNAFPWVLNGLVEAWVSLKRVQAFVNLPDIDRDAYYTTSHLTSNKLSYAALVYDGTSYGDMEDIDISHGSFTWHVESPNETSMHELSTHPNTLQLYDICLNVKQGAFVGVCSRVGGGKTSLLNAILGEMGRVSGHIAVPCLDGIAIATQEPWLQHASVRDNILFGRDMNYVWYNRVLRVCALTDDLQILKDGDMTEVGEQGVTLSGGQRSRVALARAVYQDKQLYLLDDPFSAVDAHVANHLYHKCIMGLLCNKTRILCTHHAKYLRDADLVLLMDDGQIVKSGSPQEVLTDLDFNLDIHPPTDAPSQTQMGVSDVESTTTPLIKEESKDVGVVKLKVYGSYWRVVGHCLAPAILLSLFLMQASRNINDWWLSYWVTHTHTHPNSTITNETRMILSSIRTDVPIRNLTEPADNITYYLMVYGILAAANSVFTLFRAFLFAYGGIKAARLLHKHLLSSIISATVAFFDETPIGRILNRFSSDLYSIDDSLPFILNILLMQMYGIVGTVIITCYGLPWFSLTLLPISVLYYFIQRYYRRTSREIKRISSITLSPIYAHFSESISGLTTIRAFGATQRFMGENLAKLELNQRAQFSGQATQSWLNLRLQMLGVAMVTAVAFIAVLEHHFQTVNAGLVGLAISYALSITNLLNGVVVFFTETEKQMISVERAQEFIDDVPKEDIKPTSVVELARPWPSDGHIFFDRVGLRYRADLPYALNSVSFETRPAEKLGIVGRTGSGKSSLFVALLRLFEMDRGDIRVDSVSVTSLPLNTLRSRISTIPQDPFLFSGTVRANLDPPTDEPMDDKLWDALDRCHLHDVVTQLGGLEACVGERGRFLSVGQRQLLCLARALLKNSKVLCIDEATASIDHATASLVQDTISEQFSQSTVLSIAHRVQSVLQCDRVLVMSNGSVAELDTPSNLLADPTSSFYALVHGRNEVTNEREICLDQDLP